ncbi:MAG TPA: transglycosylase SLT domain-containing protein, partial [Spirochaetia bacterium]|nr:transglycosylase SLT domain-containing protein [Spirochaetia bacterium]
MMKPVLINLPSGKKIPLDKEKILLGRDEHNDVITRIGFISSRHCTIYTRESKYFVEDLDSSNGTYVNGKKITAPAQLHHNDTITLSPKGAVFQFYNPSHTKEKLKRIGNTVSRLLRNPKRSVPLIIGLAAIIALSIFFTRGGFGGTNVNGALAAFRSKYGIQNIPADPEFIQAVRKHVTEIREGSDFKTIMKRRQKYITSIEGILKGKNIPPDLSSIAWVESKYDPDAYNRQSGARGMWQLMPATARQYGLRVDKGTDERTDPEKSTEAAAGYFNDLLSIFGVDSFSLAIAAYNAGDGVVLYGLKQINDPIRDRNFW